MMSRFISRRGVGSLLVGLFVLAQVAGVVPLVSIHLQHLIETQRGTADDLARVGDVNSDAIKLDAIKPGAVNSGAINHAHHHHSDHGGGRQDRGVSDPADQCCTLHHHLAGIVPAAITGEPRDDLITSPTSFLPRLLIEAERGRLERPPRLSSTV